MFVFGTIVSGLQVCSYKEYEATKGQGNNEHVGSRQLPALFTVGGFSS
jgi:hypothetical protein